MKILLRFLKLFFENHFGYIASLASVVGLIAIFLPNKNQTILALIAFVICLLIIAIRAFWLLNKYLVDRNENGLLNFATIAKYSTNDSKFIEFELYKFVQCKHILLYEYRHNFNWTGTNDPNITSSTLRFDSYNKKNTTGEYDAAIFKFNNPLLFNEVSVIHVKMDIDDANQKSAPRLEIRVKEKTQLIQFKVELHYSKKTRNNAVIKRKKINSQINVEFEHLGNVQFNNNSKSYEHTILNPEVGYYYRLEWDR
ncbi:hypothetical protein EMA8858_04144 [Emticicia aquatica]|uniref:SMODS-associating 2TM beta-strand rich effector domain-containing protein n=1 Tax=Emticicia aquatica TaxID=1681835 RepID=A0ABN8EZE7_9BACT|nr:hypothetical protein [Emticicia aquatica]CAH0998009.1 hypothetical protein EMA8858_04144 [Emticicia aquatica]